jgi:hypothetical protein
VNNPKPTRRISVRRFPIVALTAGTFALVACQNAPHHYKAKDLPVEAASTGVVAGMPVADLAAAQRLLSQDETPQVLNFPESGSTTATGRIVGYQSTAYVLPIRKGQRLSVTMDTPSDSAYFNIQDVKDQSGAALFAGEMTSSRTATVTAPEDATYLVRPYLNRAVARRGESSNYLLKIERQ